MFSPVFKAYHPALGINMWKSSFFDVKVMNKELVILLELVAYRINQSQKHERAQIQTYSICQ